MSSEQEQQHAVAELIEKTRICMVSTIDEHGHITARPLTRQNTEFRGDIEFVVPRDGDLIAQIHRESEVGISVQSSDGFVSISGQGHENFDQARIEQHWDPAIGAFFPNGPSTATILQVKCDTAEYWDTRGSSLIKLASFVKSAVTDDDSTPNLGNSGTVEL